MRISDWSSDVCASDLAPNSGIQQRSIKRQIAVGHYIIRKIADDMRPAGRAVDFSDPAHRCNRFFQSIDQEAGDAVNDQFRLGAPIDRNYGGAEGRSEERRVGKESVSKVRSRWEQDN